MSYKILRIKDVQKITGLSRSSIYLFIQQNKFPPAVQLGERSVGWKEADIINWINEKEYK